MACYVRAEGVRAMIEGKSRNSNPYCYPSTRCEEVNALEWFKGFDDASKASYNSKLFANATDEEVANDGDEEEL